MRASVDETDAPSGKPNPCFLTSTTIPAASVIFTALAVRRDDVLQQPLEAARSGSEGSRSKLRAVLGLIQVDGKLMEVAADHVEEPLEHLKSSRIQGIIRSLKRRAKLTAS
jgi:hypothetical protein